MPTKILANRRTSSNGGWIQTWNNVNQSVPTLNNYEIADLDCAYANKDFHLCLITQNGQILHVTRNSQDVWSSNLVDIESIPAIGNIGTFTDISCAGNKELSLYVCAVTTTGKIVVLHRAWPNNWSKKTVDLASVTSNVGPFTRVSCALSINGTLHICGLVNTGKVYHTMLFNNGTWQNFMGDVNNASPYTGSFIDIACSVNVAGDLHLCGITANKVFHSIRFVNNTWQAGFGDVEGQTSDFSGYTKIGVGHDTGGFMHLCLRVNPGHIFHTYRAPQGGWQPYLGNILQVTNYVYPLKAISCDGSDNKLDVICVR